MPNQQPASVSATPSQAIAALIRQAVERQGGWLPFDRFMALALYAPGLGYYSRGNRQFGVLPSSGSDFVTAPELSPLFGLALAVMALMATASQLVGQRVLERMAANVTAQAAASIGGSELATIEALGGLRIVDSLSRNVAALRRGVHASLGLIYSLAQLVGLLGALALYATSTMILLTAVVLIGFQVQNRLRARYAGVARQADAADARVAHLSRHLVGGVRELLTSQRRRQDFIANDLQPAANDLGPQRSLAKATAIQAGVATAIALALVLVAAFVAPMIGLTSGIALAVFVSTHAYDALQGIVTYLPMIGSAGEAMGQLDALSAGLRPHQRGTGRGRPMQDFRSIAFHGVAYRYAGEDAPTLGPFDLALRRGEIVFVTGGNGSGKSTLMKLLTGLYLPSSGLVLIDGSAWHIEDQRGLFATVFTDYFLFDGVPGTAAFTPGRAEALLARLQLSAHVRVTENGFVAAPLSAGRRKRLALVQAILEDRPVLVLDEWTADQDADFRAEFFDRLLPELKAQGMTIIAVTHDERFFDRCDRLLRVADGRILEERILGETGPARGAVTGIGA
jgi:ABC-type siderophore export system fused ATPase/permease subunit